MSHINTECKYMLSYYCHCSVCEWKNNFGVAQMILSQHQTPIKNGNWFGIKMVHNIINVKTEMCKYCASEGHVYVIVRMFWCCDQACHLQIISAALMCPFGVRLSWSPITVHHNSVSLCFNCLCMQLNLPSFQNTTAVGGWYIFKNSRSVELNSLALNREHHYGHIMLERQPPFPLLPH